MVHKNYKDKQNKGIKDYFYVLYRVNDNILYIIKRIFCLE